MESEWKPELNWDGSTSYVAEEGDTAQTLVDQYSEVTSLEQAQSLIGTDDIVAGQTEVSGQAVHNMFNNNGVLRLDLNSSRATDQRVIDQFVFATQHSLSKGHHAWASTEYYGNIDSRSQKGAVYSGKICSEGCLTDAKLSIAFFRSENNLFKKSYIYPIMFSNKSSGNPRAKGTNFNGETNVRLTFFTWYIKSKYEDPIRYRNASLSTRATQEYGVRNAVYQKKMNYQYINTISNEEIQN